MIRDLDDLMKIKKFFESIYYPFYKDTYKYYAGKEPVGEIFAITRFINYIKVFLGKN